MAYRIDKTSIRHHPTQIAETKNLIGRS